MLLGIKIEAESDRTSYTPSRYVRRTPFEVGLGARYGLRQETQLAASGTS